MLADPRTIPYRQQSLYLYLRSVLFCAAFLAKLAKRAPEEAQGIPVRRDSARRTAAAHLIHPPMICDTFTYVTHKGDAYHSNYHTAYGVKNMVVRVIVGVVQFINNDQRIRSDW